MKDYEQLYYDEVLKNRKLICKCKNLEEEIDIYKELLKNKPIKLIIADSLIKYVKKEDKNDS